MNLITANNNQVRAYNKHGVQLAIAELYQPGEWVAERYTGAPRHFATDPASAIRAALGIVKVASIESVAYVATQYSDGSIEYTDKQPAATCKPVQN